MEFVMETIQVQLRKETFEKLQKMAIPLVDDVNSVIDRLIANAEGERLGRISVPSAASIVPSNPPTADSYRINREMWICPRGEAIPVGSELRASYLGHSFKAKVTSLGIEFNAKHFDSPSAAGIAAKASVGTKGTATSTNGWEFWEILVPEAKRWVSLQTVRKLG
jgi:hypothetical protein